MLNVLKNRKGEFDKSNIHRMILAGAFALLAIGAATVFGLVAAGLATSFGLTLPILGIIFAFCSVMGAVFVEKIFANAKAEQAIKEAEGAKTLAKNASEEMNEKLFYPIQNQVQKVQTQGKVGLATVLKGDDDKAMYIRFGSGDSNQCFSENLSMFLSSGEKVIKITSESTEGESEGKPNGIHYFKIESVNNESGIAEMKKELGVTDIKTDVLLQDVKVVSAETLSDLNKDAKTYLTDTLPTKLVGEAITFLSNK